MDCGGGLESDVVCSTLTGLTDVEIVTTMKHPPL